MFVVCAASGSHVDVPGPSCSWKLCGYLWSMFLLEAMLMSVACAVAKDIVVSVACAAPEAMLMAMGHAAVGVCDSI